MDIILLKDLDKVGFADDLVAVKSGYARNYLIPQGLAVVANKENKAELEKRNATRKAENDRLAAQIKDVQDAIGKATLSVATKVGTTGKLFGRITNLQLTEAIKEATGFEIDRRKIEILGDVTHLGSHKAVAHLPQEANIEFDFEVVSE